MDWKFISIVYDSEKTGIAISEKHVWHIAQKNTHCNPRKTRLASQNIWNCNQESIEILLPHTPLGKHVPFNVGISVKYSWCNG